MSAADHLRDAINEGCTRDDHDHIADHRAEVLAEGAALLTQRGYVLPADLILRAAKATAAAATATPELIVYRASHDTIVMGLYTTAAAARDHCETLIHREWPNTNVDWIEDAEDGVAELTVWVGGEECTTGYVVTALKVASTYDEEADE